MKRRHKIHVRLRKGPPPRQQPPGGERPIVLVSLAELCTYLEAAGWVVPKRGRS